ncbi:hypothetical protein [Aeoliella sp. SH292]|uniref:hypothetical protein n=1 Tax=Aeoliella sp. SH292 TaxID=3454464 RepID=UPI003F956677
MDAAITTELVGAFIKFTGETLAELKRQPLTEIDLDLLRLKREILGERLQDLEKSVADAARIQKGKSRKDLTERGFAATSLVGSRDVAIDREANQQLEIARREYNRAIEEISLSEHRILKLTDSWRKKLWAYVCRLRRWQKEKH